MFYRLFLSVGLVAALWVLATCTPNNIALGPDLPDSELENSTTIEVEAARDGVYLTQGTERRPVPLTERVPLVPGQGVEVDDSGRALLHFGNLLTLELLQAGQVEVQQFTANDNSAAIVVRQENGTLVADMIPPADVETLLTVQTPSADVTAKGQTRFGVVHETHSPLTWVLGLETGQDNLQVTANGVTQPVIGGQARWVAQGAAPGPVVSINQNAETWLSVARNSIPETDLGEVLLPLANMLADTGSFTSLPAVGQVTELARDDVLGAVNISLDPQGIFGNPDYILEDCNADGVQDIAVVNGIITFDFREMQARTQGLDVTVLNRDEPGQGALQILDPTGTEIDRQQLWVGNGVAQTLSIRSGQPQHQARLIAANACFLGLLLTPSTTPVENQVQPQQVQATGTATATTTQPTAEAPQGDTVVNVLQTSTERLPQNGEFQAPSVAAEDGSSLIQIDGNQSDWDALTGLDGVDWTTFSTITYDNGCATRYPDAGDLVDLDSRVQFAYDDQNLYVAFVVNDDGLVTYTGSDERYFLGDSPQLLLDLNLNGDFDDTKLSGDDVQVDFYPGTDAPRAALWRLSSLSSSLLADAVVVSTPTDTGYFLETAIPWVSLGVSPQPGDRLGIVASVNENDTPETDAQECIISTSPQRDWRNPATWGTVLLMAQ